jgi:hypothetical protein
MCRPRLCRQYLEISFVALCRQTDNLDGGKPFPLPLVKLRKIGKVFNKVW